MSVCAACRLEAVIQVVSFLGEDSCMSQRSLLPLPVLPISTAVLTGQDSSTGLSGLAGRLIVFLYAACSLVG